MKVREHLLRRVCVLIQGENESGCTNVFRLPVDGQQRIGGGQRDTCHRGDSPWPVPMALLRLRRGRFLRCPFQFRFHVLDCLPAIVGILFKTARYHVSKAIGKTIERWRMLLRG